MVQPRDQMSADVVASSFDMISGATANSDIDGYAALLKRCARGCVTPKRKARDVLQKGVPTSSSFCSTAAYEQLPKSASLHVPSLVSRMLAPLMSLHRSCCERMCGGCWVRLCAFRGVGGRERRPVDNALLMEVLEAAKHLGDVDDQQALGELAELLHRVVQVTTLHIPTVDPIIPNVRYDTHDTHDTHARSIVGAVLEDEVEVLGGVLVVNELHQVGVVQILQQLQLLLF